MYWIDLYLGKLYLPYPTWTGRKIFCQNKQGIRFHNARKQRMKIYIGESHSFYCITMVLHQ